MDIKEWIKEKRKVGEFQTYSRIRFGTMPNASLYNNYAVVQYDEAEYDLARYKIEYCIYFITKL